MQPTKKTIIRGIAGVLAGVAMAVSVPAAAAEPVRALDAVPVVDAIEVLPVAQEDRTGYDRSLFRHWIDEDRDSCSTRAEVLIDEAIEAPEIGAGCRIIGGVWHSYYDDVEVTGARGLDIDHMIPLAEAWDSGARTWSPEKRERYANDLGSPRSLVAVTARSNRQKSDGDAADWWPSSQSASCQYLDDQVATRSRWGLSVDPRERDALLERAGECPGLIVEYEPAG